MLVTRFFPPGSRHTDAYSLRRLRDVAFSLFAALFALPLAAAGDPPLRVTFTQLAANPLIASPAAGGDAWREKLSPTVRGAEGKPVEITGYLLPTKIERGRAKEFLLMRDQNACCYGRMPSPGEYLVATTSEGSAGLPATMDIPITVRGTLRIAPISYDGVLTQFYTLEDASAAAR